MTASQRAAGKLWSLINQVTPSEDAAFMLSQCEWVIAELIQDSDFHELVLRTMLKTAEGESKQHQGRGHEL